MAWSVETELGGVREEAVAQALWGGCSEQAKTVVKLGSQVKVTNPMTCSFAFMVH